MCLPGIVDAVQYRLFPNTCLEMADYKLNNPQGLNICWDQKVQPRHKDVVALADPSLFSTPRGSFVRHNWFKEIDFEQELQEVLFQRLLRTYGCVACAKTYASWGWASDVYQ